MQVRRAAGRILEASKARQLSLSVSGWAASMGHSASGRYEAHMLEQLYGFKHASLIYEEHRSIRAYAGFAFGLLLAHASRPPIASCPC